jgi:hypothetical protein
VQYFFECVVGNCHSSNWRSDGNYTDTGLQQATEYAYRVKARDSRDNQTKWSVIRYAMIGGDTNPPSPDPMTWATTPYAASSTSVAMVATTATDASGLIEYEFNETTGTGHDSSWQSDPCYVDTDLNTAGQYCYRVRARDRYGNTTAWSVEECISSLGDVNAPSAPTMVISPEVNNVGWFDPNTTSGQFYYTSPEAEDGRWWHRVIANVAGVTDDSGGPIEIHFVCTSSSGFSSINKVKDGNGVSIPIYIGLPLAIGSRAQGWRVTYSGGYIVYEVDVNKVRGSGKELHWEVCAYDASQNEACSDVHVIKWPPVQ